MTNLFIDLGLMIIFSTLCAFVARSIKQPMIPAYIIGGVLLGPVFHLVSDADVIFRLSEIGIAFLLFIVGLELDFKRLKDIGVVASLGGLIQVLLSFGAGFGLSTLFGYGTVPSIFVGLIVAFSSTLVVVKILQDTHDLDSLHGKIILGILIMQDILAIFALSAITTQANASVSGSVLVLAEGALVVGIALLLSRFVFPRLFSKAAEHQELLLMMALTVLFVFALVFLQLGFSIVIGAFVAGVSLGNLEYRHEMVGRVKGLRDFFITLFFCSLGLQLYLAGISHLWTLFIILLIATLLIKPLIVTIICGLFGYTKKTSFKTAIALAQISEFSLVIVSVGLSKGQVSQELFSVTLLLAMITMTVTTYLMKYQEQFFSVASNYLPLDNLFHSQTMEYMPKLQEYDIVVVGYDRIGYSILKGLQKQGKHLLLIDYNPEVIKQMAKRNISVLYGDISDTEILSRINFTQVKMVISTVNNLEDTLLLMRYARRSNRDIALFVTANNIDDAIELYNKGADYVILPYFLGGEHAAHILETYAHDKHTLHQTRNEHVAELYHRKKMGHQHPKGAMT